jgi:hypothetical protein
MKARAWMAAVVAAVTLAPPSALAHEGNPDFSSEVERIDPSVEGVEAEVLNFDDNLDVRNRGSESVLVKGYEGEPYLRFEPDGIVEVNTRSPAYYLNRDRFGNEDVPQSADPRAPPEWQTVAQNGRYSWHDHRVHYMSRGVPPQVEDEGERTKVFDYRVPIEVDGQRAGIVGTLYWVGDDGGFPLAPFVGLAAAAVLLGAAIVVLRRRRSRADGDAAPVREAW